MIGQGIGQAEDKPSGEFAAEMTSSGAWPEADETAFSARSEQLRMQLSALETAGESWGASHAGIFNGGLPMWGGIGASAANLVVRAASDAIERHKGELNNAITSCDNAAKTIGTAKSNVRSVVSAAHGVIGEVRRRASQQNEDSTDAVKSLVNIAWKLNKRLVDTAAVSLGGDEGQPGSPPFAEGTAKNNAEVSNVFRAALFSKDAAVGEDVVAAANEEFSRVAPANFVRDDPGYGETTAPDPPPAPAAFDAGGSGTTESEGFNYAKEEAAGEVAQAAAPPLAPVVGMAPAASSQGSKGSVGSTGTGVGGPSSIDTNASIAGTSTTPVNGPVSPQSPTPAGTGPWGESGPTAGSSSTDVSAASASASQAGQSPTNPVEAFMQGYADAGPSVNPASGGEAPSAPAASTAPVAPDPTNTSTQTAAHNPSASPQSAGGAPVTSSTPSAATPGSPMSGGGMGMPLAPPPTVSPAAPPPMAPPPPSAPAAPAPAAAAAPAPVPVSAARRERDLIAAASRRGNDPAQLARRVAAALNAVPTQDFGFYWVTALTVDGTIVVANSYGIGYIPKGVNLPEQVRMASADESIPASDRGKWATFPMLTLQGWAEQHSTALRLVIATESQFQGFDPGAAKMVLQPDDIPQHGQMQGRSRLEVIAPNAAAQLAAVSDAALPDLLPVAQADATPPTDETFQKWFNVMKPMMSQADERGLVHLKAFIEFADHSQTQALHAANTAGDATALRAAIADWIYWQHLGVLTSDALRELQPS